MQCECSSALAKCASCRRDLFAQLRGVVACRGEAWANRVAKLTLTREPWPAHEGKARSIALRWVADLDRDESMRELLAEELARWAARRWRALIARTYLT